MPIVGMSVELLMQQINRGVDGARPLTDEHLRDTITQIGSEVEEFADMQQFRCDRCGRIIERTDKQGDPVECPQCGVDFRTTPDGFERTGTNHVVRVDMLADRPDVYDPGGMGRCIRGYLGVEKGFPQIEMTDSDYVVTIDPKLSQPSSFRPYIVCAVLRNLELDNELVKILMNMQENLHWALGRDRKLAAIGAHNLDVLQGTQFRYAALAPDALRFVPLGFSQDDPGSAMTPGEVLERHGTGKKYARLLAGFDKYPILTDESDAVLSMPPIINGELTRVTEETRNIFLDITGQSMRVIDRALNVMVTNLKELIPQMTVERVRIKLPDRELQTPDLTPSRMALSVREAAETIGVPLERDALVDLLRRMGHEIEPASTSDLTVLSPAYRNDIMHPIDLIEDAAVAFGYDNLPADLVPTFTVGAPREIEERSAIARRALTGLGFHQVMTLGLTSEEASFDKWRIDVGDPVRDRAVRIENPISVEQTITRVSLLPGLLETFAINKQHDLPQQLFELGDCCFVDREAETGASERRLLAVALIGPHVGYADIRAAFDAFAHEVGATLDIQPTEHASFVPGRVASIRLRAISGPTDGTKARAVGTDGEIGRMGEVHPEVIEAYGLRHAIAVLELDFGAMLGLE